MKNLHLYLLASALAMIGAGLFLYKVVLMGFPLIPEIKTEIWDIEAHITFAGRNKPVKVSLFIPTDSERYSVENENFISKGYGINTFTEKDNRKAEWSVRRAKGYQNLFFKALVRQVDRSEKAVVTAAPVREIPKFEGARLVAAQSILTEIREKSADVPSFVTELLKRLGNPQPDDNILLLLGKQASVPKRIDVAIQLLAQAGIPARVVHGIRLAEQRRDVPLVHWLEVYEQHQWHAYEPVTGAPGIPDDYLGWWRGADPLIASKGALKPRVRLSVAINQEEALLSAMEKGKILQPQLVEFSLFSLPIRTQAVYRVLLLVPAGAFLLVILRNIVGIRTFGTFMPVLIALAFRETQLLWGCILFSIMVGLGMSIRLYFEHLKLLVVPRLASVLIVVIVLMLFFSILTHKLGIERGLSVALFPMVILTMAIERMSVVWEERGPTEALREGLGTLIVAALAYLVMSITYVEHLVFVFPELLFILLAGTLLLGRYSGYRLLELRRFKVLAKDKS